MNKNGGPSAKGPEPDMGANNNTNTHNNFSVREVHKDDETDDEPREKKWFDDDGKPVKNIIVEDVLAHFGKDKIISDARNIYIWQTDHYAAYGKNLISNYIQNVAQGISSHAVDDITNMIKNLTYKKPEDFKSMKLPSDSIPVRNGLLNWRLGECLPHDPKYFYPKRLDVDFKPEAYPRGFISYSFSRFEKNYTEMFKMWEDLALVHFRDNRYQIVSIWMGDSSDSSGLVSGEEGKTTTAEKIIGDKYLGHELFSRAGLQSLAKNESEFYILKDKWLHIASMDEAPNIANYSGLIEQLRDPYMEKPVKYNPEQQFWENTAYNILIGNKFPKATASTKAFYRSVRKIVHWRKPIGDDWKYVDQITDEEKSGMLNLAVALMKAIELRGKPYGLLSLEDTTKEYRKISDPLSMLLNELFEKDSESRIEQGEVFELVLEEGDTRGLVMETLTRTKLTRSLKEMFGVTVSRTTIDKEVIKDGSKEKTKVHEDFYQGIKRKEGDEKKLDTEEKSDTLVDAVLDYLASYENGEHIQVSEFPLTPLIKNILLYYKEGISKSDTRIDPLVSCLENPNNTIAQCVSNFQKKEQENNDASKGSSPGTFNLDGKYVEKDSPPNTPQENLVSTTPPSEGTPIQPDMNALVNRLQGHLESHNGADSLSSVFSRLGEWLNEKDGKKIQNIIDKLREGYGFNINYPTQTVSLVRDGSR
ncbi:MAG: hypothetical protein ACP5UZ_08075 [Thermoplasmata archaeon]